MAAETPALFRVGREPDPFQAWWPGDNKNHGNRFDDPRGEFGVLYAAEARRVAFMETLARFRRDLPTLAALAAMEDGDAGDDTPQEAGAIVNDWHLKRAVGTLRMMPDQPYLDVTEAETREMLRAQLASVFVAAGLDDFDLGDALTREREVTQPIARWAYEQGYQAIRYPSRLNAGACWAIFEGAQFEAIDLSSIARNDEDMLAVASMWNLTFGE